MLEQVEVWVVVGVLIYAGLHTVVSYATAEAPRPSAASPSRSREERPPAKVLLLVGLVKKILKYFPPVVLLQVVVVHLLLRHVLISGRYLEGHTLGGFVLCKAAARLQSIRKHELALWVLRAALLWNRLWLGERSAAVARTYRQLAVAAGVAAAAALSDAPPAAAAALAPPSAESVLAMARYGQLRELQHDATRRLAALQYDSGRGRVAELARALLRPLRPPATPK
jgi:hypothetical protein